MSDAGDTAALLADDYRFPSTARCPIEGAGPNLSESKEEEAIH